MRRCSLVVMLLSTVLIALVGLPLRSAQADHHAPDPQTPRLIPAPTFPPLKNTVPHLGHNQPTGRIPPADQPAAAIQRGKLDIIAAPRGNGRQNGKPLPDVSQPAVGAAASPTRIMAVGDSITQGWDGDHTWRYWLAGREAAAGVSVDFVGPYTGTDRLPSAPAGFFPPPTTDGVYRVPFDSAHDSLWGWTITDATATLRSAVTTYQPAYLLVELGWNDLNAGATAATTFSRLTTFVRTAQAASPAIRIVVATVPSSLLSGYTSAITAYDAMLKSSGPGLSTTRSRVVVADIAPTYTSAGTYDGLHPNSIGEHALAAAFQRSLVNSFGFGVRAVAYTGGPDLIPMTAPSSITATATTAGIKVAWAHVVGAHGYWFYSSDTTAGEPWALAGLPIHSDSWVASGLIKGHTYRFKVVAHRTDTDAGPESPIATAADSKDRSPDPPAPSSLTDVPGPHYVDVAWGPPTNTYGATVTQYDLAWVDRTAGSAPQAISTTSRNFRITGLVAGHAYDIVLSVETSYGASRPIGFLPVRPGYGSPPTPTVLSVVPDTTYPAALDISWTTSAAATAYFLYAYDTAVAGSTPAQLPYPVPSSPWTIGYLFPDRKTWAVCVQAINGTLRSALSSCVRRKASA